MLDLGYWSLGCLVDPRSKTVPRGLLGGFLGRLGGVLGRSLGALGPSFEGLGGLLGRLERVLGSLGTVLAAHEAINGSFWTATR